MNAKRKLKILCVNCYEEDGHCCIEELGVPKLSMTHCRQINLGRVSNEFAGHEAKLLFDNQPAAIKQIIIEASIF